ncbi:MAG: threonine ammonia-lyase, biosynthetic [Melioribacteraceae bacterium]|nr:threonine ammonia-lyase, biosynthetic [Melioribacteraceae bacterium]
MPANYIKSILDARVYDVAIETPIDNMTFLSKALKNKILIKREDLQPVFSFKLRGAYNKIIRLTPAQLNKGIIAASAGNHAQGVALAAQKLNIKSFIVMPVTTPEIKVRSVKESGATVILFGDNFDEAYTHALELEKKYGYIFIHPYDDHDVIAGQGTIGLEIARQHTAKIDAVFVPVGGGGLIAGISLFLKYIRPDIKIIGVESDESACLKAAFEKNKRVILSNVGIFADGVAVKQIGKETYRLAKQFVDEVITVTTDEICGAIKDIFEDNRSIAEPAGALSLAGLKKYVTKNNYKNKTLIAIESGANVNFDRLRHISERTELGEDREAIYAVTIPEIKGSFKTFCETLGNNNITEFNYRYSDLNEAQVFVGIQISSKKDSRGKLVNSLINKGYAVKDMTNNELAKLHIRHMVGGRVKNIEDEQIYRFEFPERPGALLELLTKMGNKWNISMFHYRNHGAAYGKVFLGLQVPASEKKEFKKFLSGLNYRFIEENGNEAYNLFLKG